MCSCICLNTSYDFSGLSIHLKQCSFFSFFSKYFYTNVFQRRSPYTFYGQIQEWAAPHCFTILSPYPPGKNIIPVNSPHPLALLSGSTSPCASSPKQILMECVFMLIVLGYLPMNSITNKFYAWKISLIHHDDRFCIFRNDAIVSVTVL